ncbi:MAG: nucleotidyltransferase family protein, partial [Candidatus Korobacteraceae bacterium]
MALLSKTEQKSDLARFALSPEAEFALACACMGFSDTAARKAQLLFGSIDCNSLMPFAEAHGLIPLICWNLNQSELRPAGFEIFEKRFRSEAHRSLLLTRELFRVLDVLAANGITALAHKGPALSCLL